MDAHKYARGHALIWGGARMTGAARLAARAALRAGAGLVSILCPSEAAATYRVDWASLLVEPTDGEAAFGRALDDSRRNAFLIGPGAGAGSETRVRVLAALARKKGAVLDADALNAFAGDGASVFKSISAPCLLTPHDGEFRRLFAHAGDKVTRTRAAAKESGAAVLLKGGDTVIAAPDGRAIINANAPPDLATAGSGDVLAGIAVGLMAQGMDGLEAGAAAAWLHGAAASIVGPGLIADDLPDALPAVLRALADPRNEEGVHG
jgi:NAD(P)H-hydrate epimerase